MKLISALILLVAAAFAQSRARMGEYALILEDPPVAQMSHSRDAHRQKIEAAQGAVVTELAKRKIAVRRSASLLVNAIYVDAAKGDRAALAAIPGVQRVQFLPPVQRDLNAAVNLVNASAAWSAVGGTGNAGAGMKIGIIDTGIDQTHAGFQDSSLSPPSGFPKGDTAFTNNKVIVARSYVPMLSDTSLHQYALPDDNSPRDRTGHGTNIAMIAAGVQNTSPLGAIQGVAPKAFLGNYKIFGSPGVNDFTFADVVEKALEDAVADGMDVVTLSINEGDIAEYGALDSTAACGDPVCDVRTQAVENAIKLGLTVVTSAGNSGDHSNTRFPTRTSIHTPGTAPNAITVGATMNSHVLYQSVRYNNTSVRGLFGDGTRIASPLIAPIRDVASTGDDGLACSPLAAGSLTGSVALVQRGTCFFDTKINNAQAAGAVAVLIYQVEGSEAIYPILFLQNTAIPAMLIGNTDGKALKSFLATSVSRPAVTLDPAFTAADDGSVNTVAGFSSRGPSLGNFAGARDFGLKPELVAPGVNIYTATQKFDPTGDTYNVTGYNGVSGTSYAVPFVAGAVALVKQKNPNIKTPGQLKSAVVNTASADVQGGAGINDAGAGKLNIGDAVSVAATLEPVGIGFGAVGPASLPISRTVTITNVSNAAATFTLTVRERVIASAAHVQVTPSTVNLAPGANSTVTVSLTGTQTTAGAYEGFIDVAGAGPVLHLPYTFFVGDGVPYDVYAIRGGGFLDIPGGQGWLLHLRVTDRVGVPVVGAPVTFRAPAGAKVELGDNATSVLGIGAWIVDLGPQLGDQVFTATVGGLTQTFEGFARRVNAIKPGGVVNAASFQLGQGLAPGSYISIFGTDLADTSAAETTPSLPVSLASVAVSFYGNGFNLPGHIHFVSPTQVNVQVPWEFQGQSSVRIKVSLYDYLWDDFVTVPLAQYSPGIFAVTDPAGSVIGAANPAKRGGGIVVYANGLGPVDIQPASGEATPATQPLSNTKIRPTATIGGASADIIFSGLTPGSIGLYQVNVAVPSNAPTGTQALKLSVGGQDVTVNISVQ